jgi:hypothetical protein
VMSDIQLCLFPNKFMSSWSHTSVQHDGRSPNLQYINTKFTSFIWKRLHFKILLLLRQIPKSPLEKMISLPAAVKSAVPDNLTFRSHDHSRRRRWIRQVHRFSSDGTRFPESVLLTYNASL